MTEQLSQDPSGQRAGDGGNRPPGGWQPQRKKRHTVRIFFISVGTVMLIVPVGLVIIGGLIVNGVGVPVGPTPFSSPSMSAKAPVGSAVVLTGSSAGEQMTVTVVKVFNDPRAASEFDTAGQGDRLYAVQFRLNDTGSSAYSDTPSNGTVAVDSAGQTFYPSLKNVVACDSFPVAEEISAGRSGLGCIVFEVPESARITLVQFTLDSGYGPETGQWKIGG
jgi:hypothetical protein